VTSGLDPSVVDDVLARLRADGETTARALAVAALDRSGDAAVVVAALRLLGEDESGLDRAEELGWLRRVDGRVAVDDPLIRTAAAHLVAPASRRAAHRALAAALDRPGDAIARALHLADGTDVPDDGVATSVLRVATEAARRGRFTEAAHLAERAIALSATDPVRSAATLHALAWWLDAADVDGVTRTGAAATALADLANAAPSDTDRFDGQEPPGLDDTRLTIDHATARALRFAAEAATWFSDGVRPAETPDDASIDCTGTTDRPISPAFWALRRHRRTRIDEAIHDGRHTLLVRDRSDLLSGLDEAGRAFHQARGWRHTGDLRAARAEAHRASILWPRADHADARRLRILVADLDLLQGRSDDVLASLHSAIDAAGASGFDVELEDQARRIRGRHQLVVDPTRSLVDVVDAWIAANGGVRGEIEQLVRAALLAGDAVAASQAADLADRHALPIEAGEARIVAASLTIGADRRALAARADQQLARCGVRCWDGRLALLLALGATAASAERDESLDLLTAAELRVAEAVGDGLTNREVAAQLFLSVKTVDFHLQQIYRKLGIRSRTELVVRLTRPAAPRGTS
jgi:DNA-binding NarL/FixJ family response regulator